MSLASASFRLNPSATHLFCCMAAVISFIAHLPKNNCHHAGNLSSKFDQVPCYVELIALTDVSRLNMTTLC